MSELENALFSSGLPVEALMEKAALAVAGRLQQPDWWARLQRRGALVLVGPGHNGGDGLVVARELHLAGIRVRIWSPFERRKPLTDAHWRHARWLGIPALEQPPQASDSAIWIDALFGIGQSRAPGELLESLLEQRQQQQPDQLIAIDGPTGLCSDRGILLGRCAARAGLSLSIGLLKRGLLQDTALAWVGQLERIDLGLANSLLASLPRTSPRALHAADLEALPPFGIDPAASKYQRGRLLVVAGSSAYRGAAQLCLLGASASGVGSLRAALPAAVAEQLWTVQPHVVISAALADNGGGGLALNGLSEAALERLDAVVLGPGLGPGVSPGVSPADQREEAEATTWQRLQNFPGLLLLDADGLNRLTAASHWLRGRQGPTWITPHAGEFQRLFPDQAQLPPLQAATAAAAEASGSYPCSVLLKGARTLVAAADGRCWQLRSASPMAARAGLGDVLAGYAGGLAAVAMAASGDRPGSNSGCDAALLAAAALAHAQAGERSAAERGRGGATPMAVAEALQHIIQPQR